MCLRERKTDSLLWATFQLLQSGIRGVSGEHLDSSCPSTTSGWGAGFSSSEPSQPSDSSFRSSKKKVEWSQKIAAPKNCLRRAYTCWSQQISAVCGDTELRTQQLRVPASQTHPQGQEEICIFYRTQSHISWRATRSLFLFQRSWPKFWDRFCRF